MLQSYGQSYWYAFILEEGNHASNWLPRIIVDPGSSRRNGDASSLATKIIAVWFWDSA